VAPPPTYGYGSPYPPGPYWQAPPPEPTRTWYGWQTLLADGASLGLILVSASGHGESLQGFTVAGVLGYFFAPPIVHWAHGNASNGFASLGIRAGGALLVVVGAVGAYGGGHGSSGGGPGVALAVAGVVCMIAAIPIDAAALAYDEPKRGEMSIGPLHHLALAPDFGRGSGAQIFETGAAGAQLDARSSQYAGVHGGLVWSGQF
jgi:hypothetical protein